MGFWEWGEGLLIAPEHITSIKHSSPSGGLSAPVGASDESVNKWVKYGSGRRAKRKNIIVQRFLNTQIIIKTR